MSSQFIAFTLQAGAVAQTQTKLSTLPIRPPIKINYSAWRQPLIITQLMRGTELLWTVRMHVSITVHSDRGTCTRVCVFFICSGPIFTNDPVSFRSYVNSTSIPLSSVELAYRKNTVTISSRFPIHHQTFKIHNSSFLRYAHPTAFLDISIRIS